MEVFYPLKNYEEHYEINKLGQIRSLKKNYYHRIQNKKINDKGYEYACISMNNKVKKMYIHRLLAIQFIENPNPEKFNEIDHFDKKIKNNDLENLSWCDRSINNTNRDFKNKTSKYKYISFCKSKNKWIVSKNRKTLGHFDTEQEAFGFLQNL